MGARRCVFLGSPAGNHGMKHEAASQLDRCQPQCPTGSSQTVPPRPPTVPGGLHLPKTHQSPHICPRPPHPKFILHAAARLSL